MRRHALMAAVPAIFALAAADAPPRDWAETLRRDVQAFHDHVAADHPGPHNRLDPGFAARSRAALALALRRARRVTDEGGYRWAMRGYVASFDDGHLAIDLPQPVPPDAAWPGFLTGFDAAGAQIVRTRADDAPLPVGARLEGCDGVAAERLAARDVGAFWGRWHLASQRALRGGRLFLDAGNPFVARPRRCRFAVDGRVREVALAWRTLPGAEIEGRLAATAPRARPEFGARTLADGTRWFTMPSFNGDPDAAPAKALVPMIAAMRRDRDAMAAAPRIVLDLRGNGGGSSDWSRQIAVILWGDAAVARVEAATASEGVDWRASAGNLAELDGYRAKWRDAADVSPEAKAWAERIATGLRGARDRGAPLWRETEDAAPAAVVPLPAIAPPRARIMVLTDWSCGSACLDAVDLWTALGAVQVGQETSADSLYMDVRAIALPSGLARAIVPMKVYRGRRRGSNVPATPEHRYPGDMRDTDALARWIASLPS